MERVGWSGKFIFAVTGAWLFLSFTHVSAAEPLNQKNIQDLQASYQKKASGGYGRECVSGDYIMDYRNPYAQRRDCFLESYYCSEVTQYTYREMEDRDGEFQKCARKLWLYVRDGRWGDIPKLKVAQAEDHLQVEHQTQPGQEALSPLPDIGEYTVPDYAKDPDQYEYARSQLQKSDTGEDASPSLDHGPEVNIEDFGNTEVLDVISTPPETGRGQQATQYCLCKDGDIETLGQCNDPKVRGVYPTGYYPWTSDCKHPVAR